MSRTLKAREIAERVLRLIGDFPVTESAADPESLRETLHWLDLNMAEVSGTMRLLFQIPEPISLPLAGGQQEYFLPDEIADYPDNGIQFPVAAWMEDASGNRYDIKIVARDNWIKASDPDVEGTPCEIYIDRLPDPTLYVRPVPPDDDVWTLYLEVQTFSHDVSPAGVSGTRPKGATETGFRDAWQRWLIYKTGIDVGGGPVRTLSEHRIARFEKEETKARLRLEAFENRQHDTEDPVVEPYGMDIT